MCLLFFDQEESVDGAFQKRVVDLSKWMEGKTFISQFSLETNSVKCGPPRIFLTCLPSVQLFPSEDTGSKIWKDTNNQQ